MGGASFPASPSLQGARAPLLMKGLPRVVGFSQPGSLSRNACPSHCTSKRRLPEAVLTRGGGRPPSSSAQAENGASLTASRGYGALSLLVLLLPWGASSLSLLQVETVSSVKSGDRNCIILFPQYYGLSHTWNFENLCFWLHAMAD